MENEILEFEIKGKHLNIEKLQGNNYYAVPYSENIEEVDLMNSNELKEKLQADKIIVQLYIDENTQKIKGYYIKCK